MKIKEALLKGTEMLKKTHIETPVVDAGVILCHVLNCDKAYLYTHDKDVISEQTLNKFFDYIRERIKGKPVSYIIGKREFMSLIFLVNSSVLIPRPDTEILVESLIKHINSKKVRILDIGTGSGCIAISLAYFLKNCHVTACDISQEALDTAKQNAINNRVDDRIDFVISDLFSIFKPDQDGRKNKILDDNLNNKIDYKECGKFDVIVSNPPYIPTHEMLGLDRDVRDYEPKSALAGGIDGLDFYRAIIHEAGKYLKPKGLLAFEVGYNQAEKVEAIMLQNQFEDVSTFKDLAGINRVVMGNIVYKVQN